MSNSKALTPSVAIATAYQVAFPSPQPALSHSQALQTFCQISGVNQTSIPEPSPSR